MKKRALFNKKIAKIVNLSIKKAKISPSGALFASGIVTILLFGAVIWPIVDKSEAGVTHNMSGFAWSDTVGWISFNCLDEGTCATVDYGVNVDGGTGILSGFAWSDTIGWISFNEDDLTGCPSGTCAATLSGSTLSGWARALSPVPIGSQNTADTSSIGHWRFESGTGVDDSGDSNDIGVSGTGIGTALGPDGLGGAISMDGNGHFFIADASVPEYDFGTNEFTITGWFKTSYNGAQSMVILSKRGICNYGNFYDLDIESGSDRLNWEISQNASSDSYYKNLSGATAVNDNEWHHFAVTRSGTSMKIYLDGVLDGSGTTGAVASLGNTASFRVGASQCTPTNGNSSSRFIGSLDDFRVYNSLLLDSEILEMYTNGVVSASDPQAGGWDGWLSLSGSGHGVEQNGFEFEGFAWGADVLGWVSFNCEDTGSCNNNPYRVYVTPTIPPEISQFDASPSPAPSGSEVVLTWISTDSQTCTISGGWSGVVDSSGSISVGEIYSDTSFTLTCENPLGEDSETVIVLIENQDFDLNKSNDINAVYVGSLDANTTITVYPLNGFVDEVSLSASPSTLGGVPVTYEFSDGSLDNGEYEVGSVMTILSEDPLPTGEYVITVTGVSGTIERTVNVNLYTSQVVPRFEEI